MSKISKSMPLKKLKLKVFYYDFFFSPKYSTMAICSLKWKQIVYSQEIIKVSTWIIS